MNKQFFYMMIGVCIAMIHNQEMMSADRYKKATFAGGCFWCMEAAFQDIPGIIDVISGYTGGSVKHPTYEKVSTGKTGHYEAVLITYDPDKLHYTDLLDIFWKHIDPTDAEGQFADKGSQYKTAVFYHNELQKKEAEKSKQSIEQSGQFKKPIVTKILPAVEFYKAEEDHQDYYKKKASHYKRYKIGSGREKRLRQIWGRKNDFKKPSNKKLREKLTPLQYRVTQENATEPPFDNKYVDNKEEGLYVDVVSGEPLFSSKDKFDSGSGWPSFTKPIIPSAVIEKKEGIFGLYGRTEVRSKIADSHLGHLFSDGPKPTGLRYCINSAALRFIPKEQMAQKGYAQYLDYF